MFREGIYLVYLTTNVTALQLNNTHVPVHNLHCYTSNCWWDGGHQWWKAIIVLERVTTLHPWWPHMLPRRPCSPGARHVTYASASDIVVEHSKIFTSLCTN